GNNNVTCLVLNSAPAPIEILSLSLHDALPISTPVMGDFHTGSDGNWWLRVVGKGNKARLVTVSDDMLDALRRYRRHLGLSNLPYVGEQAPLVPKIKGRGPVTSTRQIRYLVQSCFDASY